MMMMVRRGGWARRVVAGCGIGAGIIVLASGCGLADAPLPQPTAVESPANILANPGFESGRLQWIPAAIPPSAEPQVSPTGAQPHGGSQSVELKLDAATAEGSTRAVSFTQGTAPTEFPEFASGFYRVNDWQPHSAFQYVYFSVTVQGGDFEDGAAVHEIRFVIGPRIAPSLEPGVAYIFLNRNAPVLGRWTYFSYPVRQAFAERFQKAPARWTGIDFSVGVRLDGRGPQDPPGSADVQYDDLYLGPQSRNPNRPIEP